MATNFPASLDTDTQFPSTGIVANVTAGEVSHSMNLHGAVQEVEKKLGIGAALASGASTGWILVKNAAGTTTWQAPTVLATVQSGASYTLVLADAGQALELTSASAVIVTVPPNSSVAFATGTLVEITRMGTGTVTVAQGAGVTIRTPSTLVLRAQYSTVSLRKRATDEWVLAGDTT